eukprot:TRINITY_DN8323_c0_g1_i1.p1 TRINITY_DN8323_c0_g1~~TRINITY_DN8323_c0_g1_i1.p1  ORF type:complete len:560 (-),score=139.40 TRINITY_DN8323_c0_g1_i1:282-1961(-)
MNVTPSVNGVKIYNVSMGKSLPQWIKDKKNKSGSLKKDDEFRRRIELIQDFDFPTASQKVKATPDGQFVVACGTYKPALRVWDLEQLTLKLSRNVDAEIVDFEILGQDWTKIASLRSDRYIDFMSSNGVFHNIQIPRTGRGLCYDRENCDLLSWGACGDVWRINLEQGRFLSSIETELDNINCGAINPLHQLMTFGGENGVVQCFDPRIRTSLATKDIRAYLTSHPEYSDVLESDPEITSLHHHTNGLVMGVGVSTGQVLLYDLRASEPLVIKDHRNSMPIKSIEFLEERRVLSADSKGLKFWEQDSGKPVAAVECQSTVNDVYHFPGTGLFLTANEQEKLMAFFIPSLSPAPKWCSFLDSLTEELEEDQQSVFEDYKFITREQCEQFGFANMIGTEYLKPYMHGYFIGIKLYNKLKAVTKPFEYDGYIQGKVDEKNQVSRNKSNFRRKEKNEVNQKSTCQLRHVWQVTLLNIPMSARIFCRILDLRNCGNERNSKSMREMRISEQKIFQKLHNNKLNNILNPFKRKKQNNMKMSLLLILAKKRDSMNSRLDIPSKIHC